MWDRQDSRVGVVASDLHLHATKCPRFCILKALRQVRTHMHEFNNLPHGVNAFGDVCKQLIKRIPDVSSLGSACFSCYRFLPIRFFTVTLCTDQRTCKQGQARDIAVSTLHSLISNILSKPDDDTFRRIRPSHPVLQTKLTQWDEAALCFAALGFRSQLEDGGTDASHILYVMQVSIKNNNCHGMCRCSC